MSKKQIVFMILFSLTIIAFFLRVLPFGYGPFITFSDTGFFRQALNLGKAVADYDFSLLKAPTTYPYFFSYILLFFFGIFYLIGIVGGLFASSAEFIKYTILQMDQLFEASRILITITGTLLIPLVYIVTRHLISMIARREEEKWAIIGSLLATILITFSLLQVHYAKLLRAHVPVAFFFFLSFYFYLIFLRKKNTLSYVMLGLTTGVTAGTLQNGILAILFLILGCIFLIISKKASWQFLLGFLIFFLIIIISYPYLFLSPKKSLGLDSGMFNLTLSGEKITDRGSSLSSFSGAGFISELKGLFFYEPGIMIILLFLLIICLVLWSQKRKTNNKNTEKKSLLYIWSIWGAIVFVVSYFVLFGIYSYTRDRMLNPLIAFLCTIIGVLAFIILSRIQKKYKYWIIISIALILIFPIAQSIRLTTLTIKDNTQSLAAKWIKANIDPNEMIALESHSRLKLTPSQESLKTRTNFIDPDSMGQKDKFLLSLDKNEYPKDAMMIFPLFVFKEDYNKIYEFLKTEADYLVLGRYAVQPGIDPSEDHVHQITLSLDKELVQRFIPFKNHSSKRISKFPLGIENPIIDLWSYERMGPVIEIYKINH